MAEDPDTGVSATQRPSGRPGLFVTQDVPIYSHTGLMMMNGRPVQKDAKGKIVQHLIVGFSLYERKMRAPWVDAGRNNPYGMWWIQKARIPLDAARGEIDTALDEMDARLGKQGFTLETFPMPDAKEVYSVKLVTGIGMAMKDLIRDLDLLESSMLFLRSLGAMSNNEFQNRYKQYRRRTRGALRACMGYEHIPIDRSDVRDGSENGILAREKMGEVPTAFLGMEGDDAWLGPIVIAPNGRPLAAPRSVPQEVAS